MRLRRKTKPVNPMRAMTPDSDDNRDIVAVGKVIKAHGVHGEVKVLPLTNVSGRFESIGEVFIEKADGTRFQASIDTIRGSSANIIASFRGVESREDADALRGAFISVKRSDMPALEPDQYYTIDLVGMQVVDEQGDKIGTVSAVEEYPAIAALVIDTASGPLEIPAVHDYIMRVDKTARMIIVRIPVI